jgi:hypothetical protein
MALLSDPAAAGGDIGKMRRLKLRAVSREKAEDA